jgi:uncharacterized membrane protein
MGVLRYRSPTGETRLWTPKEVIQGKPIGHPSHPMFVHFPVALYIFAVVLDILSRVGDFPGAPLAATWAIIGGFLGTVAAVVTGLVDYLGMTPGSRLKRWATRHMLLQLTTFALFLVNFLLRWPSRDQPEADMAWIIIGVVGIATLSVGQWIGGILVYRMGMRVESVEEGR